MSDTIKLFLYALVVPAAFILAGVLSCAIDYALNKSIIDAISASDIQWWHFFTFDDYMTWQYVNNPGTFWGIYIGAGIGFYVLAVIIIYYVFD